MWSNDPNVDPVGACVGARGARVRMVVNELRGEKVDIVPFSEDPPEFVMQALSPAKVKEVRLDEETGTAKVIVPDYQLSLAIGKEGQNARLAARLTGWRVDIKSETQLVEEEAGYADEEWAEGEWVTDDETGEMVWQPAEGGEAMTAEAVRPRRRGRGDGRQAAEARRRRRPRRAVPPRPNGRAGADDAARRPSRGGGPQLARRRPATCIGCRDASPTPVELVRVRPPSRRRPLAVGRHAPGTGRLAVPASRPGLDLAWRRASARALRAAPATAGPCLISAGAPRVDGLRVFARQKRARMQVGCET